MTPDHALFPRLDETRRLAALHALQLLDSDPEEEFDALVALAAEMLDCPSAFISLVDRDRQWLKARENFDIDETSRDIAFCDHTIRQEAVMVVDDATLDTRFAASPLVTRENGIRFYAGSPIRALDEAGESQAIGALCVVDSKPRTLNAAGRRALHHFTTLAEALIAARTAARRAHEVATLSHDQAIELARKDRIFRRAERLAKIGSWRINLADDTIDWSDGVSRIHDLPPGQVPTLGAALGFYPPDVRGRVTAALTRTIEHGDDFDIEEDFTTANGEHRHVRALAEREIVDGVPTAIIGVFQDVTERHALETQLRRSADTDELTGIANRAAFNRALELAIGGAQLDGAPLMLALIDLDGFKEVNDTLGHLAGDDVLRAVGRRLQQPWLRQSIAARLGGDEFALIVSDPVLTARPSEFVERLQRELCLPVTANGLTIATAGTVGVALLGRHDNVRDFVHAADTDLYAAKRQRIGNRRRRDRRRAAA